MIVASALRRLPIALPDVHATARPSAAVSTPPAPSTFSDPIAQRAAQLQQRMVQLAPAIHAAQQAPNSFQGQVMSLGVLRNAGLLSSVDYETRLTSLSARFQGCDEPAAASQGWGANKLWSVIHPARHMWGAAWGRFRSIKSFCEAMTHQLAHDIFYTDDNVQLTGVWIKPNNRARPTIVMCLGNAEMCEHVEDVAQIYAARFDVNVFLYNSRGVGLSLGDVTTPSQSILDCKAAILHAASVSPSVCVWACSLGGALAARVLTLLQISGHPWVKRLSYFVCVNSFPTLADIMGEMMQKAGFPIHLGRGLASRALQRYGIDPLDTARVLRKRVLPMPVLVCNSQRDEMMRGHANLAVSLSDAALPEDALQVLTPDAGTHNNFDRYLDDVDYCAALDAWRQRIGGRRD